MGLTCYNWKPVGAGEKILFKGTLRNFYTVYAHLEQVNMLLGPLVSFTIV